MPIGNPTTACFNTGIGWACDLLIQPGQTRQKTTFVRLIRLMDEQQLLLMVVPLGLEAAILALCLQTGSAKYPYHQNQ